MASNEFEIGVLLHTRHLIREDGTTNFEPLWNDAAFADDLGVDHLWLGDSVTILDKARGDCLTTMAAVAAKTRRAKIGTVPLLAALRNPVLLAHALATLDVISQGRVILAVSVGSVKDNIAHQFDSCGVPHHQKAGRLTECIELMRRLWTEKSVTYDGKYYQVRNVGILPPPFQRTTIPILFAAGKNENALKRAGRLGDGWVTTLFPPESFVRYRGIFDDYAIQSGRTSRRSMLYASFNLNYDGVRARQDGWRWMEDFFHQPRTQLDQHLAIFGTPDECAETLREYTKAGLTGIIARIASEDQRGQMNLLVNELKPRVRGD